MIYSSDIIEYRFVHFKFDVLATPLVRISLVTPSVFL